MGLRRLVHEAYSSLPSRAVSKIFGALDTRISFLPLCIQAQGRWYSREGRGIYCNVDFTASRMMLLADHVGRSSAYQMQICKVRLLRFIDIFTGFRVDDEHLRQPKIFFEIFPV